MMNHLIKFYKDQNFHPTLLGLFINPSYFVRASIYKSVKKNARALTGVLLDFGCGSKPYQHLFKSTKYIGIDVKQEGYADEQAPVDVYYDGKNIPFTDKYFDACFSSEVFEHVFDLPYSLKEIHRVLKADGKCLFIVPFVWEEHSIPYDCARYTTFGLSYFLEQNGFKILKQEKDSHFAEVLAQLWCSYLHNMLQTKNKYANVILRIIFISPFILAGWAFKTIAPHSDKLYFNNVILAQKI